MSNEEARSLQFIYHTLGLSEIRLNFELSCRKHDLEIKTWWDEKTLKAGYDRVMVGNRLEAVLPDAFFVFRLPEQRLLYFFLEYDRSLENLKFIRKKMAAYVAYFHTRLCEQRYGTSQIRVLTVCEGKRSSTPSTRLTHLKKMTEEAGGVNRYYFADITSLVTQDVTFDPIWQVAGGANPVPLMVKNP